MATPAITPIRQFAVSGDNYAGRGSSDGSFIYIPTVTNDIATLSKYDLQGNLLWARNLENSSHSGHLITSQLAVDGSVIIATSSEGNTGLKSAVAKYSPSGEKIWEFINPFPTSMDVAISGNTLFVCGTKTKNSSNANDSYISAYSVDSGALIWTKAYPNSGASDMLSLEVSGNNIFASALKYEGFASAVVGRLDLDGNEIWWKSIPANDWNGIYNLKTSGDSLIASGGNANGSNRDLTRLLSFRIADGAIEWDKSWGSNRMQGSALGSLEIIDKKIFVAHANNEPDYSVCYTVVDELDLSGNLINTYKLNIPDAYNAAGSLIRAGNSVYLVSTTNAVIPGQSSGGGYDVYLASVVIENKPVVRGNSLYTIVDGPSWTQAEANSVKLGGHLAQVSSLDENDFLTNRFDKNSRIKINSEYVAWIGITYDFSRNEWTDVNGQKQQFFNWYPGQPDQNKKDLGRVETSIILSGSTWGSVGVWDDSQELQKPQYLRNGIAETSFIRRGDSAYVIVQGPTWEEAEANAVKLGGHLVTINDSEEWSWFKSEYTPLKGYAYKESFDFYPNGEVQLWVGVNDKYVEGQYAWISGESSTVPQAGLLRLGGGTPINDDYGVWQWEQGRVALYTNDTPSEWQAFAKNIRGVAEIKLAPNNTSTGTPTLSGTSKVGSTITIDATTIKDVDNFTGYTPTYNYSFEVSGDSGTTWTKLTSTDATDNNSTYTLTTAEVGKKVRGVVSYLDGYGTNESVASDASTLVIGNQAPTNLSLSSSTFNENIAGSSQIGTLSSTDPDSGNTFNYSLVSGTGSTDNAAFTINANQLKINASPDFESKSSYSIRVRTTDQDGLFFEKSLNLGVLNVNETPTDISPSTPYINFNATAGSAVFSLSTSDPDAGGSFTYALVAGTGSTDNAAFTLSNNQLSIKAAPVPSKQKTYSIRVRSTDQGGLSFEKSLTLSLNFAPTALSFSTTGFNENIVAGSVVSTLSSTDPDPGNTFTYSLVSGTGSTDNGAFSITGNQLKISASPDYESKAAYSVRVRTTDQSGLYFEKSLSLVVANVNEAPTDISASTSNFNENIAAGSVVATLTSTDPDKSSTFTYALVSGAGSTDNSGFSISKNQLQIKASPDYETKSSYAIRIQTKDQGGLTFEKSITFSVNDLNEAPTNITITATSFNENIAAGTAVATLGSTSPTATSTFTYALVTGNGSIDNGAFTITGNQLKISGSPDFETKSDYVIRVKTTDQTGLSFEKNLVFTVNNVNEAPLALTVSSTTFNENIAAGSIVANLGTIDPDASNSFTYALVAGTAPNDNAVFSISGNQLKISASPDYEAKSSYQIRVRTTDQGGLVFEKDVALSVNNLVEKVSSSASTTLASNKDTLELTGTKNIFGTGNQFDNTIIGNSGKNKLTGGLGKDILTGAGGIDTFFYSSLKDSLISGFDVITDYTSGEKISTGFDFEGDDLIASTGKATAFNEGAIGSVLSNTTFFANNAAAFTIEGLTGTFLALNDGRDGFQADSDALIHLSKYTIGSTTPISII